MATQTHNEKLNQKRAERQQKDAGDSPAEKREVVMHGAKLNCEYAQGLGDLVVTSNELQLQDKLWATEGDGNNMVNLQFKGTCGHPKWPEKNMSPPPCMSVIKLSPWQNLGTTNVQEQKVLVKESTITCDPDFNSATASPIPKVESIAIKAVPTIVDAYFAKFSTTKTGNTSTFDLTKVEERGLSYGIALVIETIGLEGKKVKVKIKSGARKVLSDVDSAIPFIDLKDIDAITDPANYKNVATKEEFEVEIGKLSSDASLSNKDDFKDKGILKLMLNQKPDNLSFDLAKLIATDTNKEALVYVEITCSEPDVEYMGVDSGSGIKNSFLKEEGKYFKIKNKEQIWLTTAREEMEKGITEATHCETIKDYHQVNREHKPSGCATITNAWCASFIGWCLKENNLSAQCDPGAYTYGHTNTRYRNKKVVRDGKSVTLPDHFDDPVWAKTTDANKIALGSICVVNGRKHVTFAVAQNKERTHLFGLGGNQGDAVKISAYSTRNSSVYPIEYTINEEDYELPIYYRELKSESVT